MSHASLAARYRPQSFAAVAGQDTVKTILSRAAAEDRVAPAYLLSGTRGVGKTTIARIFAKALNCIHAPAAEPCNACEQCRRITQGNHVDVVEIDGASNRGIDDARRLREAIAYAPMEGRYKVFIIDEAHMLTRDAFNALLKTLEEPPPRSTFILATTEPHKFPVTIVSRCQHFTFKALPETALVTHLTGILHKEGVAFEEAAVQLIARRAAGSVRDGMSLLGQSLALSDPPLTERIVRDVLGLAGQEIHERLLRALQTQDCPAVVLLVRDLLEQGVDLGFFLRELASLWRNLFLLRQAGAAALPVLDAPEAEKRRLLEAAQQFDLAYIHAAWQMVLESQRQITASLEPASSLELLLLNLVLLPQLVSLEQLSRAGSLSGVSASGPAPSPCPSLHSVTSRPVPVPIPAPSGVPHPTTPGRPDAQTAPSHSGQDSQPAGPPHAAPPHSSPPQTADGETPPSVQFSGEGVPARSPQTSASSEAEQNTPEEPRSDAPSCAEPPDAGAAPPQASLTWEGFLNYCTEHMPSGQGIALAQLRNCQGTFVGNTLHLQTWSTLFCGQLRAPDRLALLNRLAEAYAEAPVEVQVLAPSRPRRTEAELKKALADHPVVKMLEETFDASLIRCMPLDGSVNSAPTARGKREKKEKSKHA